MMADADYVRVKRLPPAGANGERWSVWRPDGTTLGETVAVCDTVSLAHEVVAALDLVEALSRVAR